MMPSLSGTVFFLAQVPWRSCFRPHRGREHGLEMRAESSVRARSRLVRPPRSRQNSGPPNSCSSIWIGAPTARGCETLHFSAAPREIQLLGDGEESSAPDAFPWPSPCRGIGRSSVEGNLQRVNAWAAPIALGLVGPPVSAAGPRGGPISGISPMGAACPSPAPPRMLALLDQGGLNDERPSTFAPLLCRRTSRRPAVRWTGAAKYNFTGGQQ